MVQESKLWYDYIIMVLSGNAGPYICMRGSAGAPYTSLANRGNNLEKNDLNNSILCAQAHNEGYYATSDNAHRRSMPRRS